MVLVLRDPAERPGDGRFGECRSTFMADNRRADSRVPCGKHPPSWIKRHEVGLHVGHWLQVPRRLAGQLPEFGRVLAGQGQLPVAWVVFRGVEMRVKIDFHRGGHLLFGVASSVERTDRDGQREPLRDRLGVDRPEAKQQHEQQVERQADQAGDQVDEPVATAGRGGSPGRGALGHHGRAADRRGAGRATGPSAGFGRGPDGGGDPAGRRGGSWGTCGGEWGRDAAVRCAMDDVAVGCRAVGAGGDGPAEGLPSSSRWAVSICSTVSRILVPQSQQSAVFSHRRMAIGPPQSGHAQERTPATSRMGANVECPAGRGPAACCHHAPSAVPAVGWRA